MQNKKTFPFILGLFISSTAIASEFNDSIDKIFSSIEQQNSPGCNVGLIKEGSFIHKTGYGLANLELNVPLDGMQVHRMASVSKQFTAMAVLLLAEEGVIDLDANISTYLKELNDYGEIVTVRSMLGHYSGMGDYDLIAGSYEGKKAKGGIDLKSVAGNDFRLGNEDYLTIKEFYDVVKTVPLALKPEQKLQYSNLAYFLLSMLVEEVSGKSLRDYADEKIFKPLDMTNTFFSDNPVEIVKNRATGYKKNKEGNYITDMTNLFWVGDGGLHTNLDDLLKWDQNFYTPKVGKEPIKLMELMNKQNSSYEISSKVYANGQFVGETLGRKSYAHGGGWLGASTYYIRFPEEKFSLVMLCNDVSLKAGTIRKKILELYFNGK
ncbi:MAG: beta-lactamase family protein [Colwellia sp.]|nr:beta-lactamase family protein [Colwellia sp.]